MKTTFTGMTSKELHNYEGSLYRCTAHFPSIVHRHQTIPSDFESPSLLDLNVKICKAISEGAYISGRMVGYRYKDEVGRFKTYLKPVKSFEGI